MGNVGFNVPLGTFTGIRFLNALGPNINLKMVPIGNVNCSFYSQFTSVGINQSHHRIYITMTASVSILLPIATHTITTMEQILICESIIIGEVPETYLNTDNLTNALNLIPN
jgi:sporulation protein YunB